MSVKKLAIIAVLAIALLGLVPVVVQAQQAVCPEGGEWTGHINVNAQSYTFSVEAGKVLTGWCYKASTTVNSGSAYVVGPGSFTVTSSVTNDNGQTQNISHASFRLIDAPPPPPPTCEELNNCPPPPPPPECDVNGATETLEDDCPPPPPPPCEEGDENCPPPPPECDEYGETENVEDDCPPPPPPPDCEQLENCPPPPPPPPVCETDCQPDPPPGPIGCVLSPLLLADAGNSVVLTSPDGQAAYYTYLIEARGDHSVVNIGVWTNTGTYGLYYYDDGVPPYERRIGLLTITASAHGDLTCVVTLEAPEGEEEVVVCVGCGPRVEEWYLNPETGAQGRAIDLGDGTFYVEAAAAFDGSASRNTPLGIVYYGVTATVPDGLPVYAPCSVTVTLSQATINGDGTWTFTVLSMQWRSEWELAAARYGFGSDFVDLAMSTPVGSTFTVAAP